MDASGKSHEATLCSKPVVLKPRVPDEEWKTWNEAPRHPEDFIQPTFFVCVETLSMMPWVFCGSIHFSINHKKTKKSVAIWVVSNVFHFHLYLGKMNPFRLIFFQMG